MIRVTTGSDDAPFESKAAIARWFGCSQRTVFNWADKQDWPAIQTPNSVDAFLARNNSPYAKLSGKTQQRAISDNDFTTTHLRPIWRCFAELLRAIDNADATIKKAPPSDRPELRRTLDATLSGELRAIDLRTHAKADLVAMREEMTDLDD